MAHCVEGGAEEGNFKGTFAQTVGTLLRTSYWSQLQARRMPCRTLQTQSHRMNGKRKSGQRTSLTTYKNKLDESMKYWIWIMSKKVGRKRETSKCYTLYNNAINLLK